MHRKGKTRKKRNKKTMPMPSTSPQEQTGVAFLKQYDALFWISQFNSKVSLQIA